MKITLKDINNFLTANPNKRINVSSPTNCVIAQILKSRGIKNPYCLMERGSNRVEYNEDDSLLVPKSWNDYNHWFNDHRYDKETVASKIRQDFKKFSRKGDSYYI